MDSAASEPDRRGARRAMGEVLAANLHALRARGVVIPGLAAGAGSDAGVGAGVRAAPMDTAVGPVVAEPVVPEPARERLRRALVDIAAQGMGPLVIEGLAPAWVLRESHAATAARPDGFARRLLVVQEDGREAEELRAALSREDLSDLIADPRVEWFLGASAGARLAAWLDAHDDLAPPTRVLRAPGLRTGAQPPIADVLAAAAQRQERAQAEAEARVRALYDGASDERGARALAQRFAPVLAGGAWNRGEPAATVVQDRDRLRVLIPTTRYSTFVRHAAEDLAAGLRSLGHEAVVLREPDDHSALTTLAHLRAVERVRPDLVVLINYAREHLGSALPASLPVVTWVQDAMAHLFTSAHGGAAGAASGDAKVSSPRRRRDFVVGHVFADLRWDGLPAEHGVRYPMVASAEKFHAAPVSAPLREQHACEIAYVSHHAEAPAALRQRLDAMAAANPLFARCWARGASMVDGLVERLHEVRPLIDIGETCEEIVREAAGPVADPAMIASVRGTLVHQFCVPYAERLVRHRAVAWAAAIAERRGWRLRLRGRGWERSEFARFAAGPVEHGEDLRAAYQCAALNLHASVNGLVHQRVLECALSGGLPACTLHGDELFAELRWFFLLAPREGVPPALESTPERPAYAVADSWRGLRLASLLQRLGMPVGPTLTADEGVMLWNRLDAPPPGPACAAWLLGDLASLTFRSEGELEAIAERAVQRPEWRAAASAGIAGRVRRYLTHRVLADMMLKRVAMGLQREADGG
jgi:hypothetical protein